MTPTKKLRKPSKLLVARKKIARDKLESPETAALNIRDFPTNLLWVCKACAAESRLTLREYVVKALRTATESSSAGTDERR